MKIVAIIMKDDTNYTVGVTPLDLEGMVDADDVDARVSAIDYHRKGNLYNGGFQTGRPGYSVKIADSDIRRLVPEEEVKEIQVDIESHKKKKKDGEKVIPELQSGTDIAETDVP
jgi:hypothetical protein